MKKFWLYWVLVFCSTSVLAGLLSTPYDVPVIYKSSMRPSPVVTPSTVLESLFITGDASVAENSSSQYTCFGIYDDTSTNDVTSLVTWTQITSLSNVTLNATGLVTVGDRDTTNSYSFRAYSGSIAATNTISIVGTNEPPAPPAVQTGFLPEYKLVTGPTTNFPVAFAAFDPPVSNYTPEATAPEVYEHSRNAGASQAFIATGTRWSGYTNAVFTDITVGDDIPMSGNDRYLTNDDFTNAVIELVMSTYETPTDGDRIMRLETAGGDLRVLYDSAGGGLFVVNDGSDTTITNYTSAQVTILVDTTNQTASVNGQEVSFSNFYTNSTRFRITSETTGANTYPMTFVSMRIWTNSVLGYDLVPHYSGAISNKVDGSLAYSDGGGDFTVNSTRSITNSGELGKDTYWVGYANSVTQRCDVVLIGDNESFVRMPSDSAFDDTSMVWPANEDGAGYPVILNAAILDWVGPSVLKAGELFNLFGQNLGTNCYAYVVESNAWIQANSSHDYKAEFTIPANYPTGDYTVYAHNTHGREYGWSHPQTLAVTNGVWVWAGTVINVTDPPYNAVGDGVTDDTVALREAYDDLGSGDLLYAPAGTYLMESSFPSRANFKMYGDGTNSTILLAGDSGVKRGRLFDGSYNNICISNLTLRSKTAATNVFEVAQMQGSWIWLDTIQAQPGYTNGYTGNPAYKLTNTDYFRLRNSTIHNNPNTGQFSFNSSAFGEVSSNRFILGYACSQSVGVGGLRNTSFIGNTFVTNSTPADGRIWVTSERNTHNLHIEGNVTIDQAPTPGEGNPNTGEQILLESAKMSEYGTVAAATSNTLTMAEYLSGNTEPRDIVLINSGKGFGQWRRIESRSGLVLTLEENWRVTPDTNSTYKVGGYPHNWTVYNNTFDGKYLWVTNATASASTGIVADGTLLGLVCANNTYTDLRYAIRSRGLTGTPIAALGDVYDLQPSWWHLYKDITVRDCARIINLENDLGGGGDNNVLSGIYGQTFRNISVSNSTLSTINVQGSSETNLPTTKAIVFEGCDMEAVINAVLLQEYCQSVVVLSNSFSGTGYGLASAHDLLPVLQANTWSGFTDIYETDNEIQPSGDIMSVPQRVITNSTSVEVWNTGTATGTYYSATLGTLTVPPEGSTNLTGVGSATHTITNDVFTKTVEVQ